MHATIRQMIFGASVMVLCLSAVTASGDEPSTTVAPAKVTLATRLAEAKHITLIRDQELGGYRISIYTPEQQKRNLEELAAYEEQRKTRSQRLAPLEERFKKARQSGADPQELDAIRTEREAIIQEAGKLPTYKFAGILVQFCKVVSVGEDFLELKSETREGPPWLLPLRFVCSVQLPEGETGKHAE